MTLLPLPHCMPPPSCTVSSLISTSISLLSLPSPSSRIAPHRSPSIVHSPASLSFHFFPFLFIFSEFPPKVKFALPSLTLVLAIPFPFPFQSSSYPKKKKKSLTMSSSDGMSTFLRSLLLLSLSAISIANAEYRSYDGTGNNRANPLAGSAWTPFLQNHTIAKTATYPEQQQPIVAINCPISPPPANSWAAGRCVSNIAMSYDTPVNNTVQRQEFVSTSFRTHMVQKCFFYPMVVPLFSNIPSEGVERWIISISFRSGPLFSSLSSGF